MLRERITEGRHRVLEAWFESIVSAYPDETSRFLRTQQDPFHNPVGTALRGNLDAILDAVAGDADLEAVEDRVDAIIRIRALQDFTPSAAVAFVPGLKHVLREVLPGEESDRVELEDRIDQLALVTFDVYCRCRDAVADIRVEAIRNRSMKVMERFNAWAERREVSRADGVQRDGPRAAGAVAAPFEEGGGS